ncbi:MAG: SDR family oxidoreductase [Caulobacterales bacterium]|nr:SDR family oxidoreductase [Caulobacterales bacterium]
MRKLEGKVALVTGGGRGIGRAVALKLASEGARVVVNDLDEAPASEVAQLIRAGGGEALVVAGSVTAEGFGERFVGAAMDAWGDVHIIVNNAGYTWDNVVQKMSDEQFQAMLDLHLVAPFRILRAAAEPIRLLAKREAAEGREVIRKVVNISSIAAGGNPGQANYASAKAGLIGLTKTLSREWGRYKVAVNCVAFGWIRTRLTETLADMTIEGREIQVGLQGATLAAMDQMIPLGRGGTPEEAAGSVYLFCIPESDYVSGQVVICGGGMGSI